MATKCWVWISFGATVMCLGPVAITVLAVLSVRSMAARGDIEYVPKEQVGIKDAIQKLKVAPGLYAKFMVFVDYIFHLIERGSWEAKSPRAEMMMCLFSSYRQKAFLFKGWTFAMNILKSLFLFLTDGKVNSGLMLAHQIVDTIVRLWFRPFTDKTLNISVEVNYTINTLTMMVVTLPTFTLLSESWKDIFSDVTAIYLNLVATLVLLIGPISRTISQFSKLFALLLRKVLGSRIAPILGAAYTRIYYVVKGKMRTMFKKRAKKKLKEVYYRTKSQGSSAAASSMIEDKQIASKDDLKVSEILSREEVVTWEKETDTHTTESSNYTPRDDAKIAKAQVLELASPAVLSAQATPRQKTNDKPRKHNDHKKHKEHHTPRKFAPLLPDVSIAEDYKGKYTVESSLGFVDHGHFSASTFDTDGNSERTTVCVDLHHKEQPSSIQWRIPPGQGSPLKGTPSHVSRGLPQLSGSERPAKEGEAQQGTLQFLARESRNRSISPIRQGRNERDAADERPQHKPHHTQQAHRHHRPRSPQRHSQAEPQLGAAILEHSTPSSPQHFIPSAVRPSSPEMLII